MYKQSHKALSAALLTVVAVLMWCFNHFTPLFLDDWHYAFIFGTQEPIRSLGDILVSQWHHYSAFNGRFIVHFFVQLFDGILGKGTFNVVNAFMFALLLYVLAINTSRDKHHYYSIISVAFVLILLLMSGFKYVFLWLSGAVNSLWVGVAVLCFRYMMEKEEIASWARLPLFLFGFVCGWSNEALVVGLGAAYFFYYAFHRKRICCHRLWM